MRCSNCGAPIADNVRFCPSCGVQVGEPTQITQVRPQPTTPLTPPPSGPHVQYIPPSETGAQPPVGPNRTLMWVGVAAGVVLLIALAVLIPLLLRGGGGGGLTTTTEGTTSTLAPTTTVTVAPTTTVPVAGPVGDSVGSWVEISVPGGPWAAQEVAVSDEALLIVTPSAAGYKLSAVMLETSDVVTISQSEALFGVDLDGLLAVWWEASGWNAGTEKYTNQYIKSCLLPGTAKNTIATGGSDRIGMPQVASGVVTWVVSAPWVTNPEEYWAERIMAAKINGSGAATGAATTLVPAALAFALGDSSWQYSLSGSRVTWEHSTTAEGYDIGTHVMRTDKTGHRWMGEDAWRPSLWGDMLVYQDGSLQVDNLATESTRLLDPSGDFAAAGPTFAAYYKPSSSGSFLVARGYTGAHEQTLDEIGQPPYFAPIISVSPKYIAYAHEEQLHLFEWQTQ